MCLISLLRIIMVNQSVLSADATYEYAAIVKWTSIEVSSAIVVSCLIVLKPLLRKFFPRLFTSPDQGQPVDRTYSLTAVPEANRPHLTAVGDADHGCEKDLVDGDTLGLDAESQASSTGRPRHE